MECQCLTRLLEAIPDLGSCKPSAATHPCWKLDSKSWCFNPTPYCCWLSWTCRISPTCVWAQPLVVAKMFVFLSWLSYPQSLQYPPSGGLQREAGCPENVITSIHLTTYPNIQNWCLSIPLEEQNRLRNMGNKGNIWKKKSGLRWELQHKVLPIRKFGLTELLPLKKPAFIMEILTEP